MNASCGGALAPSTAVSGVSCSGCGTGSVSCSGWFGTLLGPETSGLPHMNTALCWVVVSREGAGRRVGVGGVQLVGFVVFVKLIVDASISPHWFTWSCPLVVCGGGWGGVEVWVVVFCSVCPPVVMHLLSVWLCADSPACVRVVVCCCGWVLCLLSVCVWQAFKGTWWMPWHQEPMKDVGACDKPWGVGNRAVIRGCPNGETRLESCPVTCA